MVTSRQFKSALIAALIFAASAYPGQAQPVPQAPAGNAVPVTADNFNRAETDMYFGKRVKRGGVGNLSHSRELYLTDSPVVRPNRDTLYSGAVFDYDAGPVTITLPDAGNRFMSMQVIDEDQYTHAVYYGAGRYTMTREEMGTRYGSLVIRILANPKDPEDMKQVHALQDAIMVEQKSSGKYEVRNFDPVSQKKVRDFLRHYSEENRISTVLTSHYMQDIEELCKRVIIIDHGQVFFDGALEEIIENFAGHKLLRFTFDKTPSCSFEPGEIIERTETSVKLKVPRNKVAEACRHILSNCEVHDFSVEEEPIEEIIRQVFYDHAAASRLENQEAIVAKG